MGKDSIHEITRNRTNGSSVKSIERHYTSEVKLKQSASCFNREMAPTMAELRTLMNRNLRNTVIGAAQGGGITTVLKATLKVGAAGIGISIGVLGALFQWRDQILDFGRDKLEPAQAAAKEKCKKEAGL